MVKGWLKIKNAAEYADVSTNTLRTWLAKGLRHSRVGGVVLINKENLNQWIDSHAVDHGQLDEIVDEVMEGLSP